MKALVLREHNIWPTWSEIENQPDDRDVRVALLASALNHRDVWIVKGKYPGIRLPAVLGSDGCGMYNGDRVVINPNCDWGTEQAYPKRDYRILGMPRFGTFAEYIFLPLDRLRPAPEHLSDVECAALPIAGLTAYRALFIKGDLKKKHRVLINGVGGGVALMAFQMAKAAGSICYVTSGSETKRNRAVDLGALQAFDYRMEGWGRLFYKEYGGADLIIDSAGGAGFKELVDAVRPGGKIVVYGGGAGPITKISPQIVFWKQLSILGTSMGSDTDFDAMLDFVSKYKIRPIVDQVFDIRKAAAAFERMDKGVQFGKIVFTNKS